MILDRRISPRLLAVAVIAVWLIYFLSSTTRRSSIHAYLSKPSTALDQDDYGDIASSYDSSGFVFAGAAVPNRAVQDVVDHDDNYVPEGDYRIIYSLTSKDRKYFHVDMAGAKAYNPNIIPHPTRKDRWIVVAQWSGYRDDLNYSEEIACIAEFKDGVLHCPNSPMPLPVALSILGDCTDEWGHGNMRRGPRDARVFYGPEQPYIIYGSQSNLKGICLGLWIQNLWMLLDGAHHPTEGFARSLTELQRPRPYGQIQKNYFMFWDNSSRLLAHYDIYPDRAFSWMRPDGTPLRGFLQDNGLNVAEFSQEHDKKCIDSHFPKVRDYEGIHQGTNTLSITMCQRSDPTCIANDDNTFIMHIMQHKSFVDAHALYEPYPVLFRNREPYELYAVAQKPLYYHGRNLLTEKTKSRNFGLPDYPDRPLPTGHTTMIYTTSMSWKSSKQTYHGFLDDVLLLNFGIEDTYCGVIDVRAADLVQDLAFC